MGHASERSPVNFEFWEKVVSPTRNPRRGQVVRPKLDLRYIGDCGSFRKARGRKFEKKLAFWTVSAHVDVTTGHGSAAGG